MTLLPTYTATAAITTLPVPTFTGAPASITSPVKGWFDPEDNSGGIIPVSGCVYPGIKSIVQGPDVSLTLVFQMSTMAYSVLRRRHHAPVQQMGLQ